MAPSVLILGGVGFIGRNLVTYLVQNNLASEIRVVDKVLPETAYLNKQDKESFSKIQFIQGNLANSGALPGYFVNNDGKPFDYVFNLAAETKYSQPKEVYEDKVQRLSVNCGKEAEKQNVKCFIEVSTAQVYDADKKNCSETEKIKPWTVLAQHKRKAEEELLQMKNLNLIIVRPAIVYGPGDQYGITPRLICGRVYKKLNEELKLLWTKDLRINTVHVSDVVKALWHLAVWYDAQATKPRGEIFNLADKTDTDQETVNAFMRKIFGIETGFQGSIISQFAKLNLNSVTEDINEKHLAPWYELLKGSNINTSPLSPYLDEELLYNNPLYVNGSKIVEKTGFSYDIPLMTEEKLRDVIKDFQEIGIWPSE